MPRTTPKIGLSQVTQQSDSHCGPAVLQLLFAHVGKKVTQDQVVKAGRVQSKIKEYGMRPHQLARAAGQLSARHQFWFKNEATIDDLATLIHTYHWPVAVNWQGLFYDSPEEEAKAGATHNDENSHYSVVTDINLSKNKITIVDTYREYSRQPRVFSLDWFEKRWWDEAEEKKKKTGRLEVVATKRLLFVIVPNKTTFPQKLGMQLPEHMDVLRKQNLWLSMRRFLPFLNS